MYMCISLADGRLVRNDLRDILPITISYHILTSHLIVVVEIWRSFILFCVKMDEEMR